MLFVVEVLSCLLSDNMGHLVKCGPAGVTTGKMREKSAGVTVQTELCWQEFGKSV